MDGKTSYITVDVAWHIVAPLRQLQEPDHTFLALGSHGNSAYYYHSLFFVFARTRESAYLRYFMAAASSNYLQQKRFKTHSGQSSKSSKLPRKKKSRRAPQIMSGGRQQLFCPILRTTAYSSDTAIYRFVCRFVFTFSIGFL